MLKIRWGNWTKCIKSTVSGLSGGGGTERNRRWVDDSSTWLRLGASSTGGDGGWRRVLGLVRLWRQELWWHHGDWRVQEREGFDAEPPVWSRSTVPGQKSGLRRWRHLKEKCFNISIQNIQWCCRGGTRGNVVPQIFFGGNAVPLNDIRTRGNDDTVACCHQMSYFKTKVHYALSNEPKMIIVRCP